MQDNRIDALLKILKDSKGDDSQQVRSAVENSLSADQKALFQKAVSDRNTAQQLLQTPEAIELLKKLKNGGVINGSE